MSPGALAGENCSQRRIGLSTMATTGANHTQAKLVSSDFFFWGRLLRFVLFCVTWGFGLEDSSYFMCWRFYRISSVAGFAWRHGSWEIEPFSTVCEGPVL